MSFASAATTSALPTRKPDAPSGHRERLRHRVELDARPPSRRAPAGSTAARSRRSRGRRTRSRARRAPRARARSRRCRCMNSRSTHAVVGLCGNESTTTRGRGHASSHASSRFSKKILRRRPWARCADLGAGEDRAPDVDRVRRARHERGVARAEQHPHQVREALLGADRADAPRSRGRARRRTCAGRASATRVAQLRDALLAE